MNNKGLYRHMAMIMANCTFGMDPSNCLSDKQVIELYKKANELDAAKEKSNKKHNKEEN